MKRFHIALGVRDVGQSVDGIVREQFTAEQQPAEIEQTWPV